MIPELTFAFAAGTIATANPCGFALLPAYVARQLHDRAGEAGRAGALAHALAVGGVTTAGFLLVFGTIGTAMSLGARWLTGAIPFAALAIGIALVAAGIGLLAGRPLGLRLPVKVRLADGGSGYRATFLFGTAYGLTSLACTLPIFLVVVAGSIPAGPVAGGLMFAAYAAGMGTILTGLAVAAALSRGGLAAGIRRTLPYVDRASALLLIAAGSYVIYYWAVALLGPADTAGAARPIEVGTRLASLAQAWLGSPVGRTLTGLLALGLAALAIWVVAVRFRPGRRRRVGGGIPGADPPESRGPAASHQPAPDRVSRAPMYGDAASESDWFERMLQEEANARREDS